MHASKNEAVAKKASPPGGWQAVQAVAPVSALYWPDGHPVQTEEPVMAAYDTGRQALQVLLEVAPVLLEYFPVSQAVQNALVVAPFPLVWYFPASQGVQAALVLAPAAVWYFPAMHWMQALLVFLPIPGW